MCVCVCVNRVSVQPCMWMYAWLYVSAGARVCVYMDALLRVSAHVCIHRWVAVQLCGRECRRLYLHAVYTRETTRWADVGSPWSALSPLCHLFPWKGWEEGVWTPNLRLKFSQRPLWDGLRKWPHVGPPPQPCLRLPPRHLRFSPFCCPQPIPWIGPSHLPPCLQLLWLPRWLHQGTEL